MRRAGAYRSKAKSNMCESSPKVSKLTAKMFQMFLKVPKSFKSIRHLLSKGVQKIHRHTKNKR